METYHSLGRETEPHSHTRLLIIPESQISFQTKNEQPFRFRFGQLPLYTTVGKFLIFKMIEHIVTESDVCRLFLQVDTGGYFRLCFLSSKVYYHLHTSTHYTRVHYLDIESTRAPRHLGTSAHRYTPHTYAISYEVVYHRSQHKNTKEIV